MWERIACATAPEYLSISLMERCAACHAACWGCFAPGATPSMDGLRLSYFPPTKSRNARTAYVRDTKRAVPSLSPTSHHWAPLRSTPASWKTKVPPRMRIASKARHKASRSPAGRAGCVSIAAYALARMELSVSMSRIRRFCRKLQTRSYQILHVRNETAPGVGQPGRAGQPSPINTFARAIRCPDLYYFLLH
ncbi:hypothetical protein R20233_02361 [Ralstonia sp. LMG 32965]|nr:hypothetical protein R20233_02361 [Ralstonia sp. LMG 32965]